MARPPKYRAEFAEQAEKLCKLGLTDKELAEFFKVCEATINTWKHVHKPFLAALKKGKLIADGNVAEKLYQRATGYEHAEDDIRAVNGEIVMTPTTRRYPPDTAAAIFWLKNRQPQKWREKPDGQGDDDAPTPVKVEVMVQDARKRNDDSA